MAIYHCSVKIIGRSSGRSTVGAAAYRSGEKLENERDGLTHDYTNKQGVEYSEILTPPNAPDWASDRELLWNEVEKIEKQKDAQLAREINVALPTELDREKQIELVKEYVKENFTNKGMVADINIHDKGDGNPHAHIMLTMRPFEQDGTWGAKGKKEYILDKNGDKIKTEKGNYKSRKIETTDWNKIESLEKWREDWATKTNLALEREGHTQRIDHRSNQDRGIEQLPTIHEGTAVREMERRGIQTDIGNLNREIISQNKKLEQIKEQEILLSKSKIIEQEKQPELKKDSSSFDHEKIKISELLQEAWDYRKVLDKQDLDRAKQLGEWRQEKEDLSIPFRKEAIEIHLQERWGQKWADLQKEKRTMTQTIRDYNDGKGYGFFDKHVNGKYEKDGHELRRQSQNLDHKEKDLSDCIERERQELINPRNKDAFGKYTVDKLANKLAQERDPDYQRKRENIQRVEDKIISDRQASLPDQKLAQNLCRNLEKIRDKKQEIEISLPRDQTGKRIPITKAMEIPQIKEQLKQVMGRTDKALEQHHKSLERSRGLER